MGSDDHQDGPELGPAGALPYTGEDAASGKEPRTATASWDIKEWDTQDTRPSITEFQDDSPTQEMRPDDLPSECTGLALARLARLAQGLLDELDRGAVSGESARDALRRRILGLLERARELDGQGEHERAVVALELAFTEDPDSALAHKLLSLSHEAIQVILENYLGDLDAVPRVEIGPDQLTYENIDPRAAFLLSRIDGTLSFNEVLDVAGMGRDQALRYSAALLLRGILILPDR